MPTPDEMRATLEKYIQLMCDSDAQGMVDLFADDCWVEDPVGQNRHTGKEALLEFYQGAIPHLQVEITGPIRVAGLECAMPLVAQLTLGEKSSYVDVIDIMRFDDQGKLTSMQAYWNPMEMRPER